MVSLKSCSILPTNQRTHDMTCSCSASWNARPIEILQRRGNHIDLDFKTKYRSVKYRTYTPTLIVHKQNANASRSQRLTHHSRNFVSAKQCNFVPSVSQSM